MRVIGTNKKLGYRPSEAGMFSCIIRDEELINKVTDRKDVVLKVFFQPTNGKDLTKYWWGRPFNTLWDEEPPRSERSKLLESIKVQNIFARHLLAPRVFEVFLLGYEGNLYPALVVEALKSWEIEKDESIRRNFLETLLKIGSNYGIKCDFLDMKEDNLVCGKWVDFQGWCFAKDYKERMLKRYIAKAQWNGNTYQSLKNFGVEGYRGSERKALLDYLTNLDFKGKLVADIGCSGGMFSRLASRYGAKYVYAYDLPEVANSAFEISNYLGYTNIEHTGTNIDDSLPVPEVDIMFYLSVYRYFGFAPFILKAKTVIYEHNGEKTLEYVIGQFEGAGYQIVKRLGITGKNDERETLVFVKQ